MPLLLPHWPMVVVPKLCAVAPQDTTANHRSTVECSWQSLLLVPWVPTSWIVHYFVQSKMVMQGELGRRRGCYKRRATVTTVSLGIAGLWGEQKKEELLCESRLIQEPLILLLINILLKYDLVMIQEGRGQELSLKDLLLLVYIRMASALVMCTLDSFCTQISHRGLCVCV